MTASSRPAARVKKPNVGGLKAWRPCGRYETSVPSLWVPESLGRSVRLFLARDSSRIKCVSPRFFTTWGYGAGKKVRKTEWKTKGENEWRAGGSGVQEREKGVSSWPGRFVGNLGRILDRWRRASGDQCPDPSRDAEVPALFLPATRTQAPVESKPSAGGCFRDVEILDVVQREGEMSPQERGEGPGFVGRR